jgi:hypothetical protein
MAIINISKKRRKKLAAHYKLPTNPLSLAAWYNTYQKTASDQAILAGSLYRKGQRLHISTFVYLHPSDRVIRAGICTTCPAKGVD